MITREDLQAAYDSIKDNGDLDALGQRLGLAPGDLAGFSAHTIPSVIAASPFGASIGVAVGIYVGVVAARAADLRGMVNG